MRVGFIRTSTPCQPLRTFAGNEQPKRDSKPSHLEMQKRKYEVACHLLAAQHQRIAALEDKRCSLK